MSWRDKIAAVLAGKVGGPTPTGIHVYHSSPHDFDKFDLAKIGTGEGAQSYGHGIYVAENPAVSGQGGQYWQQFRGRFSTDEQSAIGMLKRHGFDRTKAANDVQHHIDAMQAYIRDPANANNGLLPAYERGLPAYQRQLELLQSGAPVGPRTYEVNFRAKPEELLDWDKPMSQQSKHVQDFAQHVDLSHLNPANSVRGAMLKWRAGEPTQTATGRSLYTALDDFENRTPEAVRQLTEAGIPGIRYLDEGSRRPFKMTLTDLDQPDVLTFPTQERVDHWLAKSGLTKDSPRVKLEVSPQTHNYVAFDPSRLDIMAKYGVVGGVPLGAATMGGTIDQSTYEARQ